MLRSLPRYMRWLISTAVILLVVMTLLRITLFFVFKTPQQSFLHTLPAFWLGVRFDLRDVGGLALLMLLLGAIKPLHPFDSRLGKAFWLTLLFVACLILTFTYTLDFAHFAYLSQRLNASALNFLADAQISFGMVWQTYPVIRMVLGVFIGAGLLWMLIRWRYNRVAASPAVPYAGSRWGWGVGLFLLCGLAVFGRIGQYPLRWSDAFSMGDDRQSQIALNPFQSFFSSMQFRHSSYDRVAVKKYYPQMAAYLGVDHPDSSTLNFERTITFDSAEAHPNVVFVICESFSGYKSSMWGNPLHTTPYFSGLCQQGVFFDHCFTPHFGTARGVWASITNVPDVQLDNTASRNPLAVDQHAIMNDFAGYDKFYFIGGSTSWANIRGVLENNLQGLHLYEQDQYDAPKVDVWGISDKNLFLQANKVLKQQTKPFFAVIQTADNHRPYTIPKEDQAAFKSVSYSKDSLRKYGFQDNDELNAFRYTDFAFQTFIETAKKESYFKNTIFVFVGDHGIRGDAADMLPRAWTDNALTAFHVPLLFYSPALLKPVRHSMICSQVDIMPTIAGAARMSYRNTALGRDLMHLSDTTNNIAFIIDHDVRSIGVVEGDAYFQHQLVTGKDGVVSIRNNDPLAQSGPRMDSLRNWTSAFYETARYLLLNNKKK